MPLHPIRTVPDILLSHLFDSPGARVAVIAPRLEVSRQLFLEVLDRLEPEHLGRVLTATGRERLELRNGSTLRTLSTSPGAARGLSLDVVVALDVPHLEDQLRPALHRPGAVLVNVSTPTA